MRKTLSILAALWILGGAVSAPADWTNLGIFGGQVYSIAVDPTNPDKLFAGTYLGDGLFLSLDGGATWEAVEIDSRYAGEDDFEDQAVNAVAIAPSDPDVVWVAHNHWLAKSTDGGRTWTHILNSAIQSTCLNCGGSADAWRYCMALAIHPQDPDVVYVGTTGPNISATNGAVYKTEDGGLSWQKLNQGVDLDFMVEDLAVDAGTPDTVWAVTNSNGYGGYDGTVYRSVDGGRHWTPINPKPTTGGILGLALKPDDPDTVFVACGYGVVRLNRSGDDWTASYPLYETQGCVMAADVVFAPTDANTLYAAWMAPSYYWGGDDLPKVSRGVYDPVGGTWGWNTFVVDTRYATQLYCLAVGTANPDVVYGGDGGLGMVRTADYGQTWTPVNQGLDAVLVYDVDVDPNDGSHMIAASGSGLYERPAGQDQWERRHSANFRSVRFKPGSSQTYYGGMDGYLARTDNNGADWTYSDSLNSALVTDIAVDSAAVNTVFITTGNNGRQVLRSTDGGRTFEAVLDGINQAGQAYWMNTLAIDPADNRHILAGGGNFYVPYVVGDLWESFQGGDAGSWQRTGLTNNVVNSVLIDPRDPDLMYAGCGYSQNYLDPFFKSTDGGASWQAATLGLPSIRRGLYSLWGSGADDVYAVGSYGFITHFNGIRWDVQPCPTSNTLYGIFGVSGQAVFAVGYYGTILHYDGRAWSLMPTPVSSHLYKVWAAAADDVYAVGADGVILHYDGSAWVSIASPTTENLYEIVGTATDHIFATGTNGTIIHFNGTEWQTMASGATGVIDGLWAAGPTDVYAVGNDGVILHYDGNQWMPMQSNTSGDLWGVWGSGPTDIYAVGPQGHLMHFNGNQWGLVDQNTAAYYQEIWGFGPAVVMISDNLGGIWHYDGQTLSALREQGTYHRSVTDLALHPTNPDIIYAGTYKAGVFISPNQAENWLNLGAPPSSVYAVSSGSLYAATGAGLYQLTGTGILAGNIRDSENRQMLHGAMVTSDIGLSCSSVAGVYMMVTPTGIFDLFATVDGYQMGVARNLTVLGTEVTWQDFEMLPGSSVAPGETPDTEDFATGDAGGGGYCFIGALMESAH